MLSLHSYMQGRFFQTDPIGYKDDLDWYSYVGNDPTDKVDPLGLVELDMIKGPAEAENDPSLVEAGRVFTMGPKYFTVLAHANDAQVLDLRTGKYITTAEGMYKLMVTAGYKPGQIPVFLSCNFGSGSFAQSLANLIHTPVYAQTGFAEGAPLQSTNMWTGAIRTDGAEFEGKDGTPFHAFMPAGSKISLPNISKLTSNVEKGTVTVTFAAPTGTRIPPPSITICVNQAACGKN